MRCDLLIVVSVKNVAQCSFKHSLDNINLPLTSHCMAFVVHANIPSFHSFFTSFFTSSIKLLAV